MPTHTLTDHAEAEPLLDPNVYAQIDGFDIRS